MRLKLNRKLLKLLIAVLTILPLFFVYKYFKKTDSKNYITTIVTKGDLSKEINASGIINPINVVKISTQVSGIIEKIYVDFNDQVKKGQILAELDKSILQNQLDIAASNLEKAKTAKELSGLNLKRTESLFKQNYIARAELDQANADYKTAKAIYDSAQAEYRKAQRNLSYAIIKSPVSGVVISKEVEAGQTVSASLQAPDLFKVAEDLTKMQIETSVSESDISSIKKGQEVEFTVDAYEYETFKGIVRQIRLNPTSDQNVVTYIVVIDIDNQDLKLLPGMTAFVTIVVDKKENVLKVSNNIFNFKMIGNERKESNISKDKATIYKINDSGNITQIQVTKGLSNQVETEIISSELKEGDKIIEDILTDQKPDRAKSNRPTQVPQIGGRAR